jgi:hypothetical protein
LIHGRGQLKSNEKGYEGYGKVHDGTDEFYIKQIAISFGGCLDAILEAQIRQTQRWQIVGTVNFTWGGYKCPQDGLMRQRTTDQKEIFELTRRESFPSFVTYLFRPCHHQQVQQFVHALRSPQRHEQQHETLFEPYQIVRLTRGCDIGRLPQPFHHNGILPKCINAEYERQSRFKGGCNNQIWF